LISTKLYSPWTVVITQGADTIEETAYLLDLTHDRPEPIVVTGAMRNPTLAGADGPANLLAAVQTAASPDTRGLGTLVVFADEIHAAARVRKTHTTSGHTFVSANSGPLGYLVEGQPRILNTPASRTLVPASAEARPIEVGLVTITLGDTGTVLRAAADHCDGLVVAGFGVGHVHSPRREHPR
jgi:L-asparaginase